MTQKEQEKTTERCVAKCGALRLYADRWNVWITTEVTAAKTGNVSERRVAGYCSNFSDLAESFVNSRSHDAEGMKNILKAIDKARKEYIALVNEYLKKKGLK